MKPEKARFGTSETSYEVKGYKSSPVILYIIIALLAVLLFASFRECSSRTSLADSNLDALTDSVTYYKNRLGTTTASKATLQVSNRQLQDYVIKKDAEIQQLAKEFARVTHVVKADAKLQIDSITVPYAVPVPCDFKRRGSVKDKWYTFTYASDQNGFKIDSLTIPVSVGVITGAKRKWFLGAEKVTTDVTFNNPNVQVTDLKAAELVLHTPWHKKWYVWAVVGAVGGFLISQ